jgi:hypothetical protein
MTEGMLDPSELFSDPEEQEHQQLMNYFLITTILPGMASLPPNHPVWRWENSTEAYCLLITGLLSTHIQQINEFDAWYDKQIYVIYELKQKRQRDYCLTHHHDQRDQHDHRDQDDWGSSSVEPITWGQEVKPNHDEEFRLWNNLPKDTGLIQEEETPITHDDEKRNQQEEHNTGEQDEEYKEEL